MSDALRAYAQSYARRLARKAGFVGMRVTVIDEPSGPDTLADCSITAGGRHVEIRLSSRFRRLTAVKKAQCIAHELAHGWLYPLAAMIPHVLKERAEDIEDDIVDGLEVALAQLIPWEGP